MDRRRDQELAGQFSAISRHLQGGGSVSDARRRLVDLARDVIDGCDGACITSRPPDAPPRTLSASDRRAWEIDQLQYAAGRGPCLDAAHEGEPVWTDDITTDPRWPELRDLARTDGRVRGILAFPLLTGPAPTALNLYSTVAGGLDDDSITAGALFASHAVSLMAHADSELRAQTLGHALTTSRQIGVAIGILMSAHHITEEQAFHLLRATSSLLNRKLRDVALDVTERGEIPPLPRASR